MTADRCPTCDRDGCDGPYPPACDDALCDDCADRRDCYAHAVDWRARAIAAEAERSEILGLVNPSSDQSVADRVRELIEDLREAQADAARWRKVAPMIERLREASEIDGDHLEAFVDAAYTLLEATQEPTP